MTGELQNRIPSIRSGLASPAPKLDVDQRAGSKASIPGQSDAMVTGAQRGARRRRQAATEIARSCFEVRGKLPNGRRRWSKKVVMADRRPAFGSEVCSSASPMRPQLQSETERDPAVAASPPPAPVGRWLTARRAYVVTPVAAFTSRRPDRLHAPEDRAVQARAKEFFVTDIPKRSVRSGALHRCG